MAQSWAGKAPTEVVERRWTVPVEEGDSLSTFGSSVSSVTADSFEADGNDVVFVLSGGANGATGIVTITAVTALGKTLVETFYIPIAVTTNAFGYTVRDICAFALRKVTGNGEDPEADELTDTIERLSDMIAAWKLQGADIGVPLPLESTDTLYLVDAFASAVKNNLILEIADLYDYEPSPRVVDNARRGLQLIKSTKLPDERAPAEYY